MDTERVLNPATASLPAARSRSAPDQRKRSARRPVPGNDFEEHLRRETRRSMRSGVALSIAVYCVADEVTQGKDQLLEILHRSKRETDYLGHVGDDLIAVLCTDTGLPGARVFASKVASRYPGAVQIAVATFPDPLFDRLLDGKATLGKGADALAPPWQIQTLVSYRGKRLLDVLGALFGLTVLGLPMLAIGLLVKLTSPGPAIYRQERLGHGGRPFAFYKFRSMTIGSDDSEHRAFTANFVRGDAGGCTDAKSAAGAAPFKIKGDARITRLGAFLRRTSIDELPQLYNVLKGDMSLVGPRPALPYETQHYQAWHLRRILTVRPGITGIWQVHGRSRVTFNEMVRMDLRYINDCSLWLDLKVLLKTVAVVLSTEGAG